MQNWFKKIWVPFLLLALAVALYFEFGSVETFNPQEEKGELIASASRERVETLRTKSLLQKVISRLAVGERYDSLEALVVDLDIAGFVRTGYFGKYWPATVTEIADGRGGISFVRQNGTRHNYQKFDGYDMKVVRLRTGDNETIVVFRSKMKK